MYQRLLPMAHHKLRTCRADDADNEDLSSVICFRILKTGVLERRREGGEGRAKTWTWSVVENTIASRCRKRPPTTPGGEAVEAVAAGAEALPLAGSVGGQEAHQLAALLACAREGAMAVVRSRSEVPSWLDQEWSRSQVPRTEAGLARALDVYCRVRFDNQELS